MAVISSTWIFEQDGNLYSYWPSYLKSDIQKDKVIIHHQPIDKDNCAVCPINIKYSSDDYNKAHSKLCLEEDSQTESETETQIRRTQKKKMFSDFTDSFSDTEIEIPKVPVPKKTSAVLSNYRKGISQPQNCEKPVVKIIKQKCFSENSEGKGKKNPERIEISSSSSMSSTYSCSGCEENRALLVELLRKLEIVKEDIRYIIKLNRKTINDGQETNLKFEQIDSFEELHNFNNELSDQEKFAEACNKLQLIGGKDIPDTTRKILSCVLTNNVALNMNWTGRNEKNGFKDRRNIVKLIHVCRKNPLSQTATLNDI